MTQEVSARALLSEAEDVLLERLLPQLPEAGRYEARMVRRAMQIAERELLLGDATRNEELGSVSELLAAQLLEEADPAAVLKRLNQKLCQQIRSGDWDVASRRQMLWKHLRRATAARVAITNPKLVDRR